MIARICKLCGRAATTIGCNTVLVTFVAMRCGLERVDVGLQQHIHVQRKSAVSKLHVHPMQRSLQSLLMACASTHIFFGGLQLLGVHLEINGVQLDLRREQHFVVHLAEHMCRPTCVLTKNFTTLH